MEISLRLQRGHYVKTANEFVKVQKIIEFLVRLLRPFPGNVRSAPRALLLSAGWLAGGLGVDQS